MDPWVIALLVVVGVLIILAFALAARGSGRARRNVAALDDAGNQLKCMRCGNVMSTLGVERIRTGGTTGGWKLLFGEWAELGEDMLDLEFLRMHGVPPRRTAGPFSGLTRACARRGGNPVLRCMRIRPSGHTLAACVDA